ncbi:MAG: hypothetical protein R2779_06865 [Crocinitomicaceae bacterium]
MLVKKGKQNRMYAKFYIKENLSVKILTVSATIEILPLVDS